MDNSWFKALIFTFVLSIHFCDAMAEADSLRTSTFATYNVVSVSPEQGFSEFSSLADAVDSIRDASAENPYLIVVSPGLYKVRSRLVMKPFVHVRGAGQSLTKLVGKVRGETSSLILAANNSSIQNLTIELPRNYNFPSRSAVSTERGVAVLRNVSIIINAHSSQSAPVGINDVNYGVDLDQVSILVNRLGGGGATGLSGESGSGGGKIKNSEITAYGLNSTAVKTPMLGHYEFDGSNLSAEFAIVTSDAVRPTGSNSYVLSLRNSFVKGYVPIVNSGVGIEGGGGLNVYVSRSTLVSESGEYVSGNAVSCVTTDNGFGDVLNSSCEVASLP